mgnify:CR=1 FL=1
MIPEIKFYPSPIYESKWWDFRKIKPAKIDDETFQLLVQQIKSRKSLFEEYLRDMTNILGITWKRKEIEVWMVSLNIGCFSRPLTLSFSKQNNQPRDVDHIIDDLTHELIHNALIEQPNYNNAIERLSKDFESEPFRMHVHVLVHAVHAIIYKTKRGTQRMEWDISNSQNYPPYQRAWEVVQKEGAENILGKYLGVKLRE